MIRFMVGVVLMLGFLCSCAASLGVVMASTERPSGYRSQHQDKLWPILLKTECFVDLRSERHAEIPTRGVLEVWGRIAEAFAAGWSSDAVVFGGLSAFW
jgi:hypothetical protein